MSQVQHVAIAPWSPSASPQQTSWTIVPVVKSTELAHSTLQFSPSSLALQSFAVNLQRVAPSKLSSHSRSGIEVLVLDVSPLPLETVFISLESELVKRLENGEGTFFREHPSAGSKPVASPGTPTEKLMAALRVALGTLDVVHDGDLFPLPLPPHPVTHALPAPGKVTLCEPVAQGVLLPSTKIILTRGRSQSKKDRTSMRSTQALNGVARDEDEDDPANDQFYSAAEEKYKTDEHDSTIESITETETELSEAENEDELSDDSMDDMISLQTPALPTTTASGVSTIQPGTPMTLGRGRKTNGAATPGSVFSGFTSTTARPADRPKGRLFKAHGLTSPIPSDLLHPKPVGEDDEEARVYVDISSLTRIGCFSGDWARMEVAEEPPTNGVGMFGLGSFGQSAVEEPTWRPVKVFGLPEGYSQRPVTRIPSAKHDPNARKLSFFESQIQKPTSPGAYMSPILLANLESTPYVRLAPLKRLAYPRPGQPKITGASRPPYAKSVTIQQIRTPISSERALQTAIFGGLKSHFARGTRVVKTGDLVGVPIDSQLGRALQEVTSANDGVAIDDLLGIAASAKSSQGSPTRPDSVAWFKISHIARQKPDRTEEEDEEDVWGGVACVDTASTQIAQSGSDVSVVPGTRDSNWPAYLGVEVAPQPSLTSPSLPFHRQANKFTSPLRRRLRELMAAATSKRAVHLKIPPIAILLVSTQRNIGKATTATSACADIGLHTFTIDAYDVVNEGGAGGSDLKTEGLLKARAERAMSCGPDCCALLIRHIEALTADRMSTAVKEILEGSRVLIATTTEVDKVPDGVRGLFTHELDMSAPDEGEREGILRSIVESRGVALAPEVELSGIALKTAALVAGDLVDVVERAVVAQRSRLEALAESASSADGPGFSPAVTVRDIQVAGGSAARCLTSTSRSTRRVRTSLTRSERRRSRT